VSLNQSIQSVEISLLRRDAPRVELTRNISVRSVLNDEISTSSPVVVRADENVTRPGICENSLLELLTRHDYSVSGEVRLKLRPRARIVPTKAVL
jgi:hypothetical protein